MKQVLTVISVFLLVFGLSGIANAQIDVCPAFFRIVPDGHPQLVNPGDIIDVELWIQTCEDNVLIETYGTDLHFDTNELEYVEGTAVEHWPTNHYDMVPLSLDYVDQGEIRNIDGFSMVGGTYFDGPGSHILFLTASFRVKDSLEPGEDDLWKFFRGGMGVFLTGEDGIRHNYNDITYHYIPTVGPDVYDDTYYALHLGVYKPPCEQGLCGYPDTFPKEEAGEEYYTGVAAAKQTLRWIWGDNDPDDPPFYDENYTVDQATLYQDYHLTPGGTPGEDMTATRVKNLMQGERPDGTNYDGPYYAYNFVSEDDPDTPEGMDKAVRRFIHWLDFNVNDYYAARGYPNIDVPEPNVPSLIVTGPCAEHEDLKYRWMTLRGFVTDTDPCDESDVFNILPVDVHGLWLNDPTQIENCGLGYNVYLTGYDFKTNVYEPVDGMYRSVCEPPEDLDVELFNQNLKASYVNFVGGKQSMKLSMAMATTGDAEVRAAEFEKVNWEDVIPGYLMGSRDFKEVYSNCQFNDTLKVADLKAGNTYELVTFRQGTDFVLTGASCTSMEGTDDVMWTCQYPDGIVKRFKFPIGTPYPAASIVLLVDEENGEFRQATWVGEDETYLPLSERDAVMIARKATRKKHTSVRLVFDKECGSRFLPMYEVTMQDGTIVRVMQDGTYVIILKQLPFKKVEVEAIAIK